jgi:hypothetical protein
MRAFISLATVACLGLSQAAFAETAVEKGLRLAHEADAYNAGYGDQVNETEMVLRNRYGDESKRFFRSKTLEYPADGDKSISIFDRPTDIKGTAVLTFTHKSGPDDQWLYLPALKRVKRISSANKSGSFVGSEFSYEDLSSQEVEKYTYKWIEDTTCGDGAQCWMFERYPVDKYSGYTRQEVWMEVENYRVHKIVFYDRKNELLKTLTFSDYRQYLDHYWRAKNMAMINHQTGKSTDLTSLGIEFRTGLKDRDFDSAALKRAR